MALAHPQLLRLSGSVEPGLAVENQLEAWIESCSPMQLVSLLDGTMLQLLRDAFSEAGGCEGTVWIADRRASELVACYNSGKDAQKLVGFRQPIGRGIVSMVFAQQQPYCENHIEDRSDHDTTLDKKISQKTTAMIAVPFYFGFGLRGVVSCVQLAGAERSKDGFGSTDVETLLRSVNVVERLIDGSLLASLLGLGHGG